MRLVKLTHRNGEYVYVNPAQVLTVESHPGDGASVVQLALVGTSTVDEGTTGYAPYLLIVTEAPERVVADLERALLVVPV